MLYDYMIWHLFSYLCYTLPAISYDIMLYFGILCHTILYRAAAKNTAAAQNTSMYRTMPQNMFIELYECDILMFFSCMLQHVIPSYIGA